MQSTAAIFTFSLVICTYNRDGLLRLAIESVLMQELSLGRCEVIVVDNNSTDNTRDMVRQLFVEQDNVRYVFEEKQGLSYARNRGWREAKGEYVVYIDDECILPFGYFEIVLEIIRQHAPDIFGGPIKALYGFNKPDWIKDEYFSDLLDQKTGVLSMDEFVYGGNMGIRKEVLNRLGGFNINLGMKGNELAYAEEIEFQRRATENISNLVIYFDSNLWLYHHVRQEKVRLLWMLEHHFYKGLRGFEGLTAVQVFSNLSIYHKCVRLLYILGATLFRMISIFARMPILVVGRGKKYQHWQQYLVEKIFSVEIRKLGVHFAIYKYIFVSLRR